MCGGTKRQVTVTLNERHETALRERKGVKTRDEKPIGVLNETYDFN